MATSVIILSDKSSGSSLMQALLAGHPETHLIERTPHHEGETLFWCKAAAALGLGQPRMMGSSAIPMTPSTGRRLLLGILNDNTGVEWRLPVTRSLVFDGWTQLTMERSPVFVEKSPHHLHSSAALDLMLQYRRERPEVRMRFLGLVRDPMDTLYSMWSRWALVPERRQFEWMRAYTNLKMLRRLLGDDLRIIRYEDLVNRPTLLFPVAEWAGIRPDGLTLGPIHGGTLGRWRSDPHYGFQMHPDVARLAADFGYGQADRLAGSTPYWPLRREVRSIERRLRHARWRRKRASSP